MFKFFVCFVIEILHQTTTHPRHECRVVQLYLIEILHQTTTKISKYITKWCCILLKFYIKPQHYTIYIYVNFCCILLKFYIKPQLSLSESRRERLLYLIEILHQTTTLLLLPRRSFCCILLKFYIKPQLRVLSIECHPRCILLKFYIKPQLIG